MLAKAKITKPVISLFLFSPLAAWAQSPGGVAEPRFWVKANDGAFSDTIGTPATNEGDVDQWRDRSGNNKHLFQFLKSPVFLNGSTTAFNYNPVIWFSEDYMKTNSTDGLFEKDVTYSDVHFFTVHANLDPLSPSFTYYEGDTTDEQDANLVAMVHVPDVIGAQVTAAQLLTFSTENESAGNAARLTTYSVGTAGNYGKANNSFAAFSVNGKQAGTSQTAFAGYTSGSAAELYIGANEEESNLFAGHMGEIIAYTKPLTNAELRKIESYLAIKYGKTLNNAEGGAVGDYLSAAGATVWDATVNSNYHNQVIGIARDDNSALLQKQSHSGSDTTRIYLSTLQTTNAANGGTFGSDGSFVITGNNAGQMFSTGSTEYPTGQGIYSRLEREWKITNTNFSGTFSMDFKPKYTNVTAGDLRILIDDDGDFSNAVVYNPTITFNSGVITVSGINNTMIPSGSTRYLTLVSLNANTPLPVSLTAFIAQPKGAVVELNWTTATEQNNAWFAIERSANGMEWQQIGKVPGSGNSSQSLNYSYTDAQPLEGTAYYRLKQTDVDGTYEYSPIKEVRMQAETSLRIYPNPVSNQVVLEGNQANIQSLKVFDALGKDVTHQLQIVRRTETQTVISMTNMRNGMYIFQVNNQAYKILKRK